MNRNGLRILRLFFIGLLMLDVPQVFATGNDSTLSTAEVANQTDCSLTNPPTCSYVTRQTPVCVIPSFTGATPVSEFVDATKCPADIMVPTGNQAEWSSFVNHYEQCADLSNCSPLTVTLTASSHNVTAGTPITLSWTVTGNIGKTTCTGTSTDDISTWTTNSYANGAAISGGPVTVTPAPPTSSTSKTYTLSCQDTLNMGSGSTRIMVTATPAPLAACSAALAPSSTYACPPGLYDTLIAGYATAGSFPNAQGTTTCGVNTTTKVPYWEHCVQNDRIVCAGPYPLQINDSCFTPVMDFFMVDTVTNTIVADTSATNPKLQASIPIGHGFEFAWRTTSTDCTLLENGVTPYSSTSTDSQVDYTTPGHGAVIIGLTPPLTEDTTFSLTCNNSNGATTQSITVQPQSASSYQSVAQDIAIPANNALALLTATVNGGQTVFLAGNGAFAPSDLGRASTYITLDGTPVSNESAIDWADSTAPVQHSFQNIAALGLPAGTHTIALVASGTAKFTIRSGTSLSVMANPATQVASQSLTKDSATVAIPMSTAIPDGSPLPRNPIATLTANASTAVVMASGTSKFSGVNVNQYGDAMWALIGPTDELAADREAYSDNDIWFKSEPEAPMFVHGITMPGDGISTVSLSAVTEPWAGDPVHYVVESGATMIMMSGGMNVVGAAPGYSRTQASVKDIRFNYKCVGSNQNSTGCPPMQTETTLSTGTFTIPSGHNGVVYFSGIVRLQGANGDPGGSFTLRLKIDGQYRGSTGMQDLSSADGVSTRTVSLGYLSAGANALTPGTHTVSIVTNATGGFLHLAVPRNLQLLWFD